MSIYERDYMNGNRRRAGSGFALSPVKIFILLNVACFLAEAFAERAYGSASVSEWFALSPEALAHGRVWTLLTYSFLHADILHIFCNMLGLYFIGTFLEKAVGARKFTALYLTGAIAGGALWAALAEIQGAPEALVGASASVMAVFAGFCVLYPPVPITFLLFFVLPISMRPMTMLKIAAGFEVLGLIYSLAGGNPIVAYSAHLGGLASGLAFVALMRRGKLSFIDSLSMPRFSKRASPQDRGGRASDYNFRVNVSDPRDLSAEVDRILDKINTDGFASLTDAERETLRRARDNLK